MIPSQYWFYTPQFIHFLKGFPMKKTLIALAAVAATSAAFAQSSVTLYGVADIWLGRTSSEVTENGVKTKAPSQMVLEDGGVSNSRFGLKGSEDLGGGLKANFKLEQGFSLDNGSTTAGTAFGREAWVGFSGNFGEVQLGKAYSAFDDVSAMAATVFDSDLAPINNVFLSAGFASAENNTVRYATPSFGGFSGAVSYSFGEDKTAAEKASKFTSVSIKYEDGPLTLGAGYANSKDNNDPAIKGTRLAATYDLGVAKLLATYGRVKGDDFSTNEYEIGADIPLSSALTMSFGYGKSKLKAGGVVDGKADSFGVALAYSLSKRTTMYAGINSTGLKGSAQDENSTDLSLKGKANVYAVGVKHTF